MLTDGRILLRKYRPDDVDPFYEAVRESLAQLSLWMPWCTDSYCRKEAADWVRSQESAWMEDREYNFVIADADDRRLLGGVGLNCINHFNEWANLGYWVRTSAAGQGNATAAVRLLAPWGLKEMAFQRLEILVATGNGASQRVAEQAGAVREGTLRNRILVHGRSWDAVMYSIIPSDLERNGRVPF